MNQRALIYIGAVLLILGLLHGCRGKERYGVEISKDAPIVMVKDVYLNPALLGNVITLKGEMVSQCFSAGCWFVLKDESGSVFVNLAPSNLNITTKNRVGRMVTVRGKVRKNGRYEIIAQGVEIN